MALTNRRAHQFTNPLPCPLTAAEESARDLASLCALGLVAEEERLRLTLLRGQRATPAVLTRLAGIQARLLMEGR